jgi:hypothetical protein
MQEFLINKIEWIVGVICVTIAFGFKIYYDILTLKKEMVEMQEQARLDSGLLHSIVNKVDVMDTKVSFIKETVQRNSNKINK